jgi:hypothetical protein
VLKGTCHAEVIQAVGRARLVRNAGVEVYVVSDLVLPGLRLDEVQKWPTIVAGLDHVADMMARGFVPESPTDAARLYPDLFSSAEAAKSAYHRSTGPVGCNCLKRDSLKTIATHWNAVMYQPAGARQRPRKGYWHPGLLPDPRPFLEDALGPLAVFTTTRDTPTAEDDPGDGTARPDADPNPDQEETRPSW